MEVHYAAIPTSKSECPIATSVPKPSAYKQELSFENIANTYNLFYQTKLRYPTLWIPIWNKNVLFNISAFSVINTITHKSNTTQYTKTIIIYKIKFQSFKTANNLRHC